MKRFNPPIMKRFRRARQIFTAHARKRSRGTGFKTRRSRWRRY